MKKNLYALFSSRSCYRHKAGIATLSFLLLFSSCHSGYQVVSMEGQYIPVTETSRPDREIVEFINVYKTQMDQEMNQIVGHAAVDMYAAKPESSLTNLTSDVMMTLDTQYTGGDPIDFTLMNVHGHRSPISKGEIKLGDLYNTYPFENKLIVLRLKGEYVKELFDAYARMGGAGISSTVRLKIKNKEIVEALINGEPVQDDRIYTIVTLDYLAEGNNGMQALTKAVSADVPGITLRDHMIDYVSRIHAAGKPIESSTDQRIVIIE
ncbi:MAG: 5'-nucleotidase C-terminal domain-containing protein [Tannerellaceae bacterium]|nr:5'-nucleotidase C-terminal domain-containing protein [Tannerellaceae bacterium]